MDHDVPGSVGSQYFIPPHHDFPAMTYNPMDFGGENSLERRAILNGLGSHVLADARVAFPFFWIAFISSGVKVGVRKESRHFANERSKELVCAVARGINGRALDWVGTRQLGISQEP